MGCLNKILYYTALGILVMGPSALSQAVGHGVSCENQALVKAYVERYGVSPFDEAGEYFAPDAAAEKLKQAIAVAVAANPYPDQIKSFPNTHGHLGRVQVFGNIITFYIPDPDVFGTYAFTVSQNIVRLGLLGKVSAVHQTEFDHRAIHADADETSQTHAHLAFTTQDVDQVLELLSSLAYPEPFIDSDTLSSLESLLIDQALQGQACPIDGL